MNKKITLSTTAIVLITLLFTQCKKTTEEDKALFSETQNLSDYTYYKNDNSILPSSPESAHNAFFRARFNATAQAALTDNGKLPSGGSFADGSVIVKELYDSQTGGLQLIAVMKKASGNSSAGRDWLWAEYENNGDAIVSISKKGSACTSCHGRTGNRDYVRLFELFP